MEVAMTNVKRWTALVEEDFSDEEGEWEEITLEEATEQPTEVTQDKTVDETYFLVDKILKAKFKQGWRFLTQWEGYPVSASTWEPIKSFVLPDGKLNEVFVEFCKTNKMDKILRHATELSHRSQPSIK